MGRKGGAKVAVPPHTHDLDHKHKRKGPRRLLFLLAVGSGVFVAMKRNQKRKDLDEGVWHEAPS
jgi:hypothetical protein